MRCAFHDEEALELGDTVLTLAVDFRAIDLIEHLVGDVEIVPMTKVVVELFAEKPPRVTLGKMVWALLRRHHPETTLGNATSLVLTGHVGAITSAVRRLIVRAMNFSEPKEQGETSAKAAWSIETFLIEWVALGGSPAEFWRQTPRSYVTIMAGMVRAANRNFDMAMITAWHTAGFGLNGYAGKLKGSLSDYLSSAPKKEPVPKSVQALAFFRELKARGVPVEITRH